MNHHYLCKNGPAFSLEPIERGIIIESKVLEDDRALFGALEALLRWGIVLLRGAPREPGQVERFASRVAYIRETHYGFAFGPTSPIPTPTPQCILILPQL